MILVFRAHSLEIRLQLNLLEFLEQGFAKVEMLKIEQPQEQIPKQLPMQQTLSLAP